MGCLGCLLWPFRLVWGVLGVVLGLVGHIFGAILGVLVIAAGLALLFSMAGLILWLPFLIVGGLLAVRAVGRP